MQADVLDVERGSTARGGYYRIALGAGEAAELTYKRINDRLIVIDHAETPHALRGRGVAAALMRRAADDARLEGVRILPACSYAAEWFDRHPDEADVRAEA